MVQVKAPVPGRPMRAAAERARWPGVLRFPRGSGFPWGRPKAWGTPRATSFL